LNKKGFALIVALAACSYKAHAEKNDLSQLIQFNISESRADIALTEFARQSDLTIIVPYDKVVGVATHQLVGNYSVIDGAITLLEGSGLYLSVSSNGQLFIQTDNDLEGKHPMLYKNKLSTAVLLAMSSLATSQALAQEAQAKDVEELVVTGYRG
jgi:hypothetical protein